ncbi:uncharacterized protein TRUGW13939_02126 [Talaromyces rugulosus]|uniref:FAD-binding PCMH-type domain-containing protein n=1 Tax=Talaromyces rugulosus TaxID=121627 RepID=A0A7H8QNK0_TALRU|nr:uncharacterized protein TRUGW13939_02126 [Talaromyces rugulosus]QKX55035.1 hypothetical protein TRUGW13939_02126 [Talaromyces rugulosus]
MRYFQQLLAFASIACIGHASAPDTLAGTSVITSLGASNLTTGAACACNKLCALYSNLVIFPSSANYTEQATYYWDVRADLSPACIFLPTTANEVATAVKHLVQCNAQFAVRGGGHMNFPGSNNIDGGVLLGFNNMANYQVNEDTIDVEPGMTWYDVYSALDPYGRTAIGGRLKTIGVPGLTLIGGVSYFINKYGFAMDNVVSYEVVLGDGSQVTTDSTTNPDLFWALKGGGSNFGIVTKFKLKTYSMPHISTTIQVFNESSTYAFTKAVCDWALADSQSPVAAGSVLTITYNVTTKEMSPSLLGVQAGVSNPPSEFKNFTAIPGVSKIHNVTTGKQWASTLDSPKQMFRVMFAHHSMIPDADVLYSMIETWKNAVEKISDVQGLYPTFVANISPASAARVAKTNGIGNVWGLDDEPLIWWQFSTGWDLQQDDLRVEGWARQLTEHLHGLNKHKGLARDFVYMGDAGEWQDPFAGFAPANVQRMREIRAAYDPNGTFSKLNWGGFKLGY